MINYIISWLRKHQWSLCLCDDVYCVEYRESERLSTRHHKYLLHLWEL